MLNKTFTKDLSELDRKIKEDSFDYYYKSNSSKDTQQLAKKIANLLSSNDIIVLNGELGSGKTVFMSGVAEYFEIENQICSPTFTIVNEYVTKNKLNIYHFDVYRLNDEIEFLEQVGTEYFSNGVSFIEWGNIIQKILPKNTIYIDFYKDEKDDNIRYIHIWRKI